MSKNHLRDQVGAGVRDGLCGAWRERPLELFFAVVKVFDAALIAWLFGTGAPALAIAAGLVFVMLTMALCVRIEMRLERRKRAGAASATRETTTSASTSSIGNPS